jgi:hypothetical protein
VYHSLSSLLFSCCFQLRTLRLGSNNSVTWDVCRQLLLRLPLLENFDISDIGQSLNISELCQLGTKLKKLKISGYGISHENALQLTSVFHFTHIHSLTHSHSHIHSLFLFLFLFLNFIF